MSEIEVDYSEWRLYCQILALPNKKERRKDIRCPKIKERQK